MSGLPLIEEELTRSVIGAFFEVYNALGFGFLEHVYAMALERELREREHSVAREVAVPVFYRQGIIAEQRLDMVVDQKVVIEIKSTFELPHVAQRQVYNYLRATNLEVGLLLHFGPAPKFYRMVHPNEQRLRASTRMAHPQKNQSVQSESSDSSG